MVHSTAPLLYDACGIGGELVLAALLAMYRSFGEPPGIVTVTASQTRKGFAEICARYRAKPGFLWIQHLHVQVSWDPPMIPRALDQPRETQPVVGYELRTFALMNGHWRVTSFTYNLCRPASSRG